MAQFFGFIENDRGKSQRVSTGTKLDVTLNGWDAGLRIEARVVNGVEVFAVFVTRGSHGHAVGHKDVGSGEPVFTLWNDPKLDHIQWGEGDGGLGSHLGAEAREA